MSLILSGTDGLSDVDGSAATPAIRGTDANTGIFFPAADTIAFAEGGAEVARFDSSGNLGLGVTPSAWQSVLRAFQFGATASIYSNGSNTTFYGLNFYTDSGGTNRYLTSNIASAYGQVSGAHQWYTAASGTAGNAITFTQAMTLDASGNLGIGTTSPYSAAGYASFTLNGTTGSQIRMRSSGTDIGLIFNTASALNVYTSGAIPLVLSTNDTERARIDSSGNLLVGTTSTGYTSSGSTYYSPSVQYWINNHLTGTSSGTRYIGFGIGTGEVGSITQSGTTAVLYNTTSDYRLKNDQQALTGAKDFIMALKPKKWQWWDGSGEGVGFVAHEFMEVAKYSGNGEKDAVDADGKPVYQSIQSSSSEVMANLISLVQEQQALITTLTARITALESA